MSLLSLLLPMAPGPSTGNPDIEHYELPEESIFVMIFFGTVVTALCAFLHDLIHIFAVERISAIYCLTERCL